MFFVARDADAMADLFVHDIEQGIQGTGIKAAFLKCAADEPGRDREHREGPPRGRPRERAHRRADHGPLAARQPDRAPPDRDLRGGGRRPRRRVQIAHTGDTDDLDYIERLLDKGVYIGMDRYGLEIFLPIEKRNATVTALLERGYADRMFLSQDYCATLDWYPVEVEEQLLAAGAAKDWSMTLVFDRGDSRPARGRDDRRPARDDDGREPEALAGGLKGAAGVSDTDIQTFAAPTRRSTKATLRRLWRPSTPTPCGGIAPSSPGAGSSGGPEALGRFLGTSSPSGETSIRNRRRGPRGRSGRSGHPSERRRACQRDRGRHPIRARLDDARRPGRQSRRLPDSRGGASGARRFRLSRLGCGRRRTRVASEARLGAGPASRAAGR